MPKIADKRRFWLRAAKWPAADRTIWLEATVLSDDLKLPRYGDALREGSLVTIEKAYGRYLSFLIEAGEFVESEQPAERVTPDRVARYVRHLQEFGYRAQSIYIATSGLRAAVKILAPDIDSLWIWKPNGISAASRLREPRKPIEVPDSATLFRWGLELIAEGKEIAAGYNSIIKVRDGLIIAIAACRPIRRHTMGRLTLGQQVVRGPEGWTIRLEEHDMKNKRSTEFSLPPELTEHVDYYLERIRPALMGDGSSDALWIGRGQERMTDQAFSSMVYKRSELRFGKPFGIHHFRHSYATTVISAHPEHPASAASVLAIGARMVEQHYNLGNTVLASRAHYATLEKEREEWAAFAQRRFREMTSD